MKPQNASLAVSVKGPQVPWRVPVPPASRAVNTIETIARTRRPELISCMADLPERGGYSLAYCLSSQPNGRGLEGPAIPDLTVTVRRDAGIRTRNLADLGSSPALGACLRSVDS